MSDFLRKKVWKDLSGRSATPIRKSSELVTKPDLAYTPADMARMYEAGMPVNSTNVIGSFSDGSQNVQWSDLSLDRQRGVDIADVWTASKVSKAKITKAIKQGKSIKS